MKKKRIPEKQEIWALNVIFARPADCAVAAETLAAAFDDLGALGWHEKAVGQLGEVALCVFLPCAVASSQAVARICSEAEALHAAGVLPSLPTFSKAAVEQHDWVAEFRRGFRGIRVTPTLSVVPPWRAHSPKKPLPPGKIEIIIEPGMAFGTGMHETTRLCLELLEGEIGGDARVADIGAGSGILSIAAVLLGAQSAVAVEPDPQAHENLAENVRLNGVGRQVRVFKGDATQYAARFKRHGTFDLIVCNMLFEKMRPLLKYFEKLARPDSQKPVIISGYLKSERPSVLKKLKASDIGVDCEREMGDWGAAVGRVGW